MTTSAIPNSEKNPVNVERGQRAIATARANGKYPAATVLACPVCERSFEVPESRAQRVKRCSKCVAEGRALCSSCENEIAIRPGSGSRQLCQICRKEGRRGPTNAKLKPLDEVRCIGAKTPWGIQWATKCQRTYQLRHDAAIDWTRRKYKRPRKDGYRCRRCSTLERFVAEKLTLLKSLGYHPTNYRDFRDTLRRTKDIRAPGKHPDFIAQQGQYPTALIAARRAGRGGLSGEARSRLHMATTWRKRGGPRWEIRQCVLPSCRKLLMVSTAPTAKKPELHEQCWRELRDSESGQLWLSRISQLSKLGRDREATKIKSHLPVSMPAGKHRTVETLTRNFGWTVRCLLGGESQVALSIEFHTNQGTVSRGVKETLALLPDPETADKRFRRYVDALQTERLRAS